MDPTQIPLRDLHLPDAVGWWPLAPGWWVLIGLAALGLGILIRRYLRSRTHNAARRHALGQLDRLTVAYEQHQNAVVFGIGLSELLRRTMLAYARRGEVAGLTGAAWLAWLDRDLDEPLFQEGAGKSLLELPYRDQSSEVSDIDVNALAGVVRSRLRTRVGGRR